MFIFSNWEIAERFVVEASPDMLFKWMEDNGTEHRKRNPRPWHSDCWPSREVANALMARKHPLIDLGLALFTSEPNALALLWKRNDRPLRLAIASNTIRSGFAGLLGLDWEEVSDDTALCKAIFANPSMSGTDVFVGGIAEFLERSYCFKTISDEAWIKCLHLALRHPLFHEAPQISPHDALDNDRRRAYRPFVAAWNLLASLEPTHEAAVAIGAAFADMAVLPLKEREFLERAFDKWKKQSSVDEDQGPSSDLHADANPWCWVRYGIAAGAVNKAGSWGTVPRSGSVSSDHVWMRSHPDKWVRAGAYGASSHWSLMEIDAAFERDGDMFLGQALRNDSVYQLKPVRRHFVKLLETIVDYQTREDGLEWWINRSRFLWRNDPEHYPHPDSDNREDLVAPVRGARETLGSLFARRTETCNAHLALEAQELSDWADGTVAPQLTKYIHAITRIVTDELLERSRLLATEQERISIENTELVKTLASRRRWF